MRMDKTYFYGSFAVYVCKACGCAMPQTINGEATSDHFLYCPFCGSQITAFYDSKQDAEWIEKKKREDAEKKECPF